MSIVVGEVIAVSGVRIGESEKPTEQDASPNN